MRYDGIYRIVRAYRKPGQQGQLVCRYLFIRCDNEPAPWSEEGKPFKAFVYPFVLHLFGRVTISLYPGLVKHRLCTCKGPYCAAQSPFFMCFSKW